MMTFLKNLWEEEKGQDLTEYGLILVVLSCTAIATMQSLATAINAAFTAAAGSF